MAVSPPLFVLFVARGGGSLFAMILENSRFFGWSNMVYSKKQTQIRLDAWTISLE